MATPNLEVAPAAAGQAGLVATVNLGMAKLENALTAALTVNFTGSDVPLSDAQALENMVFLLTGTGGAGVDMIVPNQGGANKKLYLVKKTATGDIVVRTSGSGVTISDGNPRLLYCDGTNVVDFSPLLGGGTVVPYAPSSPAQYEMLRYNASLQLVNEPVPYDVGGAQNGTPTASSTVLAFAFAGPARCSATPTIGGKVGTNPSGNTDFVVNRNGSPIGTMRVSAAGAFSAVGFTQTDFAVNDELTVVAPSSLNGLVDLRFTIRLSRR